MSDYNKYLIKRMNEMIYDLDGADELTDHVIWTEDERRRFLELTMEASNILKEVRKRLLDRIHRKA